MLLAAAAAAAAVLLRGLITACVQYDTDIFPVGSVRLILTAALPPDCDYRLPPTTGVEIPRCLLEYCFPLTVASEADVTRLNTTNREKRVQVCLFLQCHVLL